AALHGFAQARADAGACKRARRGAAAEASGRRVSDEAPAPANAGDLCCPNDRKMADEGRKAPQRAKCAALAEAPSRRRALPEQSVRNPGQHRERPGDEPGGAMRSEEVDGFVHAREYRAVSRV